MTSVAVDRRPREAIAEKIERRSDVSAVVTLSFLGLIASILLYRKGLGTVFYFDDWGWILDRRPWRWDIFLVPYNGHLSLVPLVVYKVLFVTVGLEHYWVYRVLLIAFHLLCVALLYVLLRRRVGDALAVAGSTAILFLGSAWHDVLVPFQISFLASVAAGLGMLIALERHDFVGDALVVPLLAVALASSTLGIPIAVACLVEMLASRRLYRLWAPAVPIGLYAAWYVYYRDSPQGVVAANGPLGELIPQQLPITPAFMADAAAGAFSGLLGLGVEWGRPLLALGVIVLLWTLASGASISVRLLSLLAFAAAYWGILGLFRAGTYSPSESRYIYLGAILIVLLAAELARGLRLPRRALAIVALLVAASAIGNFKALREGSLFLQGWSGAVGSVLGAVELGGEAIEPDLQPVADRIPYLRVGRYLDAVRDLGSPAFTPAEIARRPEHDRQAADAFLTRALPATVTPARPRAGGPRPFVEALVAGKLVVRPACVTVMPTAPGTFMDVAVPGRRVHVQTTTAPAEYRLRALAGTFPPAALGTLPPRSNNSLTVPSLRGVGWHLRVASPGSVRVCGVGGSS